MARLRADFIERIDTFADRVLDVIAALERTKCPHFVRDQMGRSGTAVGANVCESTAALSAKDFAKCLGVALKELAETRYWLRVVGRRSWVKPERLAKLHDESEQLQRILATMAARTSEKLRG